MHETKIVMGVMPDAAQRALIPRGQWLSQCGATRAASASPENVSEMQILRPYHRPPE